MVAVRRLLRVCFLEGGRIFLWFLLGGICWELCPPGNIKADSGIDMKNTQLNQGVVLFPRNMLSSRQ